MTTGRVLICLTTLLVLLVGASLAATPQARADGPPCAPAITFSATSTPPGAGAAPNSPKSASAGKPCWTDVTPYPFGSDGNPVDLSSPSTSALCARPGPAAGTGWTGDFSPQGNAVPGNPACYLQVNSMAFRAWNRGLAATGQPAGNHDTTASVGFGVWLYNGSNWFPDPTFPGSSVCPGSIVLWAGKLDYWLIGPGLATGTAVPETTLCRFDGLNLQWEAMPLPAATKARLPTDVNGNAFGGITSGACYAWNNCWFFGDDGIEAHWDGQSLSDASAGLGTSPWLEGDFTAAVAGTDQSGNPFGLAATKSTMTLGTGVSAARPTAPDGSPPTELFGSQGGPWAPLTYSPPDAPQPNDPFTTDLTALSANPKGDVWVAGDPSSRLTANGTPGPAPLEPLTDTGAPASCPGYDANPYPFTLTFPYGYQWDGLSTFPDGSALAAAAFDTNAVKYNGLDDKEPALVDAACGQPPSITEFRHPDPLNTDQDPATAPLVPSDFNGRATAVAANASNDAWAATTDGSWPLGSFGGTAISGPLAPHLYWWTDGQHAPDAPAGDDNEPRPSLFTLDPPVYQVGPPAIVTTSSVVTTTTEKKKAKKKKLAPAIYDTHPKLVRSSKDTYTLYLTFRLRRKVTIGLQALRGRKVVASTGLKHFTGRRGKLALTLNRAHWPTRVRFETPKAGKRSST